MKKKTAKTKSTHSEREAEIKNQANSQEVEFNPKNLQVNVTMIQDHSLGYLLGKNTTHLAFKNSASYAIATSGKAIKVFDDCRRVYYRELQVREDLYDLIYIDHLNCYFLYYVDRIYRKDIDESAPYFFLNLSGGTRSGASLRYSRFNERLIVQRDSHNLAVFNLERKGIELKIRESKHGSIKDYRHVGEKGNKIVLITSNCFVSLCSVNFDLKKICSKCGYQFPTIQRRSEEPECLAVSQDGKYILAGLYQSGYPKSCRITVFGVKGRILTTLATLNEKYRKIMRKPVLGCWGSIGKHVILLAFSENHLIYCYDFDSESRKLKELRENRVVSQESGISRFERVGDKLYYTGSGGKLMKLSFKF